MAEEIGKSGEGKKPRSKRVSTKALQQEIEQLKAQNAGLLKAIGEKTAAMLAAIGQYNNLVATVEQEKANKSEQAPQGATEESVGLLLDFIASWCARNKCDAGYVQFLIQRVFAKKEDK